VQIIALQTELPKITDAVTINGTTQPGYTTNPQISITKVNQNAFYDYGLSVEFGAATIKALNIYGFDRGIEVDCSPVNCAGNRPGLNLTGSRIGTNYNGASVIKGNIVGIYINGAQAASTQIGGAGANEGNVISGNWSNGIELAHAVCNGCSTNTDPTRSHKIIGNKIGTNMAGTAALANNKDGIIISTGKVTVGGDTAAERNIISGNNKTGVLVYADNSIIEGNYIGTNAAGTAAIPNTLHGVHLISTDNVRIGGTAAGTGNVISGNGGDGIRIAASASQSCGGLGCNTPEVYPATDNLIYGNRIGTNAAATAAVPNGSDGIELNADRTIIGQTANGGAANTISGNAASGVFIYEGSYSVQFGGSVRVASKDNFVQRNYIGTNSGNAILGNGASGVEILNNTSNTMVGGNDGTKKNLISNNKGHGVLIHNTAGITAPANNQVTLNDISANGGKGIAIYNNDSEGTDALDADAGPNGLQNHPVLSGAFPTFIIGTFHSLASKSFVLHFYSSTTCDASGRGEGKTYLGSQTLTTDANGNANFSTGFGAAAGAIITATATSTARVGDPTGITSEFSNCVTAQPANPGNFNLNSATYTANENTNSVVVTVNRTGGTLGGVTVNYATADGTATAGQDYTAASGTLTFASGEMSKQISIPILEDIFAEPSETVNIALSNPSSGAGLISPSSAVLTINDNDATPTLSISDVSQAEGNHNTTDFNFVVTMSGASSQTVTVNYQTAGGTATSGVDYANTNGTLSFAPGDTTKTIPVSVFGELTVELNETFDVNLSAPSNATLADAQGTGTILDDDNPGKLQFSSATYTANENAPFATITVTRTGGTAGTVTVDYQSVAGGTAVAGTDYNTVSGTLTLLDGIASRTFHVQLIDDTQTGESVTVNLALSNPLGGATLGSPASAVLTIADDESLPKIFVDDISLGEADDNSGVATFTVRLAAPYTEQVTVNYQTADDSAVSGADYQATSGTLIFAAGETSQTVTVNIVGDNVGEPHETFFLNLSAPMNATISDAQASALILNDDEDGSNKVALLPAADAYVKGASPTINFGASPELQVKRTLNPGSGKGRQSYLRFDTSHVTGTITKATLRVFGRLSAITATNHDIPVAAFPVSDQTWTETALTWANKPAPNVPQPLAQTVVTDDTERWYEFDITAFINDERCAGQSRPPACSCETWRKAKSVISTPCSARAKQASTNRNLLSNRN
jgi:hypothetical protein